MAKEVIRKQDPIRQFKRILGGRWKLLILRELIGGPKRFGELRRSLDGISQKVLSESLKEMERDRLLTRIVYPEAVLKVVYSLTAVGYKLTPILRTITMCYGEYESKINLDNSEESKNEKDRELYYEPTSGKRGPEPDYETRIKKAAAIITAAERIVIATGTGLNPSLQHFSKEDAEAFFPYFYERELLTIDDMIDYYSQIADSNALEYWRFWADYIWSVVYLNPNPSVYQILLSFIRNKEFFFISSDADDQFERMGIPRNKIYRPHGNYAYLQCGFPCTNKVYESLPYITPMIERIEKNKNVRKKDIPICEFCGDFLVPNHFRCKTVSLVYPPEHAGQTEFHDFLYNPEQRKTVFVEVCCGLRRPNLIRYPLENAAISNQGNWLIRINSKYARPAKQEKTERIISFAEEEIQVLSDLHAHLSA